MTAGPRLALLLLAPLLLAGCGSRETQDAPVPTAVSESASAQGSETSIEHAADTRTCVADATEYDGTPPAGFATGFPLPDGAVLHSVEDRGADGVIGTAVVRADLEDVLAVLNGEAQRAGYRVTSGETEEHDAEASWAGNGLVGRWAIRDSATCPGEVVIQLLSRKRA